MGSAHSRGTTRDPRTDTLDTRQTSDRFGLAPGTLANWRLAGKGPPYLKIGRTVRYRVSDLIDWMEANTRSSTSDPGPDEIA